MCDPRPASTTTLFHCIAILLLGETLARAGEHFDPIALVCVAAAIAILVLTLFLRPTLCDNRWIDLLIAVGVTIGFCRLPLIGLFFHFPQSRPLLLPFVVLAGIAAILALLILLGRPRSLMAGVFVLLLLDFGLMGIFYLNLSSNPHVDVYLIQDLGTRALLEGRNPFAITFPDIYGPTAHFYPPAAVIHGQVQSGYFYPPLSLLLDLPGAMLGDVRYSHLAAILLAVAIIGFARRHFAIATWLLMTPRLLFILENAWIETCAVLMLALVVASTQQRRQWLLPIAAGLLFVTKQYLLLTLPAAVFLLPTPCRLATAIRFAAIALASASAVTLPFIVWNPIAFFHSMSVLYTGVLRKESISFLPTLSRLFGMRLTLLCPLIAAAASGVLILCRTPRSTAGFAPSIALICLCVFAFSTQSFLNYYFFALAALCVAVADVQLVPNSKLCA